MATIITHSPSVAASFIKKGGIVAFPTETVYGLGADVFNESAIEKIFLAKDRPADNPLIAHVADPVQLGLLSAETTDSALSFIKHFSPGPLTVVLRKAEQVPALATAGLDTIGIRIPRNEIAREFLIECGTPIVAPSANLSGRPSPTTWHAVLEDLDGRIDCILKSGATEIGLESTVVDCTTFPPVLLRPGSISLEDLRSVVPQTAVLDTLNSGDPARSPGMFHRHYSPAARVVLINSEMTIDDPESSAYIGRSARPETFVHEKICISLSDYARQLFEFFRECDRKNIRLIYCETVTREGIGTALMDRLTRAAEK